MNMENYIGIWDIFTREARRKKKEEESNFRGLNFFLHTHISPAPSALALFSFSFSCRLGDDSVFDTRQIKNLRCLSERLSLLCIIIIRCGGGF
jgi:hypothetical protein